MWAWMAGGSCSGSVINRENRQFFVGGGGALGGIAFILRLVGQIQYLCPFSSLSHEESGNSMFFGCWYGASLGGTLCYINNPTLRFFSHTCLHTTRDNDQTRRHKKHKSPNKHNHHGGEATCPSSGVDLMSPCRLRGGRPCTCSFLCRR
jgi:hypothetical protein